MKDEIKEILDKLNNKAEHYILYDYEVKTLLDYITNLQEENKILKTRNKILSEDITKDKINCDVIQTVCGIPIEEIPELKLCKSRNEKAIEYIKFNLDKNEELINYFNWDGNFNKLLDILQGEDKDD